MATITRVAFLGPLGTYSHQVTSDFFGDVELAPVPRIIDVFTAVETGSVRYGVVPIENSSIGPVLETVDALRTTQLCVRSMRALKIGHAIMGRAGLQQEDVKRVYSHEQGIGQCVHYLKRKYPDAEVLACNSTARAAELARDDSEALAICSTKCAEVYGLTVYDTDIQDGGATNTTRFVVISLPTVPLTLDFSVASPSYKPSHSDANLPR